MQRTLLRKQFKRGGANSILRTYLRLHERTGKIVGEHWLWCALERIAASEPEERVLSDYMYIYGGPRPTAPHNTQVQPWREAASAATRG